MSEVVATLSISLIKVGVFIYDVVTLPVYGLAQIPSWLNQNDPDRKQRVEKVGVNEGLCYRSIRPLHPLQILMQREQIDTLEKAHRYAFKTYSNKKSLGTRKVLAEFTEKQPNGKVFIKHKLGDYMWKTYAEVDELTTNFGKGLREIGIQPKQNVMVLSETRAEYFMSTIAAFKHSMQICTLYATLGLDGIIHGINETETEILITSHEMIPKIRSILSSCPKVNKIVYFPDQLGPTKTDGFEGVDIHRFQDIVDLGTKSSIKEVPPKSSDIAVIMYTSGSTGTPKGVMLSHQNLTASVNFYSPVLNPQDNDVYIAYLPLAHVLELTSENVMFTTGMSMGYSSPLTMTDRSTKVERGCKGDLSELHPTFLLAVPLILDRVYKGILDKVNAQSAFLKKLFAYGVSYKAFWAKYNFNTPICNWIVFRKIKALMGGAVTRIASGGAPLSGETQVFVRNALGVPVFQGYGLTETSACGSVMLKSDKGEITVGPPTMGSDIKLIDWEEGCYSINDKPNPRGEIVIGGNHVAVGYYKNEKKTTEDFFEEDGKRWFKTGDIGTFLPNGNLKIIDRKKDLVKLQIGEYVSLAKVENALASSPLIENICVYAESNRNNVVAIITPSQTQLVDLAESLNIKDTEDIEKLCENEQINKRFFKEVTTLGQKAKLEKFEQPTAIYLSSETWTPDTGLVTAAFKLKRVNIKNHYKEAINRMYGA